MGSLRTAPDQITQFAKEREFLSWRGLEFHEQYTCAVEQAGDNSVKIRLDIIEFCIEPDAAIEISNCLRDAIILSVHRDDADLTARERSFGLLLRKYRRRISGWEYIAEGEVDVTNASPEFFEDPGVDYGKTKISVCSIPGGGYEIVLGFMGYSFTIEDAIWLSVALVQACEPCVHTAVDLL